MNEFIDRKIPLKDIRKIISEQNTSWLVLAGKSKIGKTLFAKKVASTYENTIFCESNLNDNYASSFVLSMFYKKNNDASKIVCEYIKKNINIYKKFSEMTNLKYLSSLKKNQLSSAIHFIIKNDISSEIYDFAHYLGENRSQIDCIFLDDFWKCDYDSYKWILEYWNSLQYSSTVVAICNFTIEWESHKLKEIFYNMISPVTIEKFDSYEAFYDILKNYFEFENDIFLTELSEKLFELYDGSAEMLFETLKLLRGKTNYINDEQTVQAVLKTAQQIHLRQFTEFNKTHMLLLGLLAYTPCPLSKNNIMDMLEWSDPIAAVIITQLYNQNFISCVAHQETAETLYEISDEFVLDIIKSNCSQRDELFYKTKLYRAIVKKKINASLEQILNLAIDLKQNNAVTLIENYININTEYYTPEKKAFYIDKFINSQCEIPKSLKTIYNIQLLYSHGYYQTAQKLIQYYFTSGEMASYDNLLLLGDIQHVLLDANASKTYQEASEIKGICVSDKIKAINRQIMSLNQEHKEDNAKALYKKAFLKYEQHSCSGLIELYRNSNNSFDYDEAIEYTIRGYTLAKELGETLEMYKCLHNICMIQLQYGKYGQPIQDKRLDKNQTFEYVLEYFDKHPEYRHEQAYPLLDLGTEKMFEYIKKNKRELLDDAKKYYSRAQLYAKSFYAQHIAEAGLLIVNSYQHSHENTTFATSLRKNMYNRYSKRVSEIKDYRVHKKILLTLALSAIISNNDKEATIYLTLANPYVYGAETLRYNKLCQKANCTTLIKSNVSLDGKNETYYGTEDLVPWLISFGH